MWSPQRSPISRSWESAFRSRQLGSRRCRERRQRRVGSQRSDGALRLCRHWNPRGRRRSGTRPRCVNRQFGWLVGNLWHSTYTNSHGYKLRGWRWALRHNLSSHPRCGSYGQCRLDGWRRRTRSKVMLGTCTRIAVGARLGKHWHRGSRRRPLGSASQDWQGDLRYDL